MHKKRECPKEFMDAQKVAMQYQAQVAYNENPVHRSWAGKHRESFLDVENGNQGDAL